MASVYINSSDILSIKNRVISSTLGNIRFPVIKVNLKFSENAGNTIYMNYSNAQYSQQIEGTIGVYKFGSSQYEYILVSTDFSIPLSRGTMYFKSNVDNVVGLAYLFYNSTNSSSTAHGDIAGQSCSVNSKNDSGWQSASQFGFVFGIIEDLEGSYYVATSGPNIIRFNALQGVEPPTTSTFGYAVSVANEQMLRFILDLSTWYQISINKRFAEDIMNESSGGIEAPDPYSGIDESGSTDPEGTGTFDFSSDPIPLSPLPTISAADTGFTRIYIPTLAQIQSLAEYLWTDSTIIDTVWNHIKQFFENPMDAFVGFNLVPCSIPSGGTEEFRVLFIGTGVQLTTAASQFVDVDCGTLTIDEVFGSALDYSPYTKIHAFLPYIGQVDLNTDEVMNRTLQIIYRIDIVTGSCVASILVDSKVLYQFSGHCAINIPFTSADFSNYVSAIISIAKTAVALAIGSSGVSTNGETTSTEISSDGLQLVGKVVRERTNNGVFQEVTTTKKYDMPDNHANTFFAGMRPGIIANTVGQVMSSKPNIQHAGGFNGNSGYLGTRYPYLIIERPNLANPSEYGDFNGRPSMITMSLGDVSGFTRVQQMKLSGCSATQNEQSEILRMLKEGVFF